MAGQSDLKKIIKDLERRGWTVEHGKKHYKAYHPMGGMVTMSVSPSCPYAIKNIVGDIRRLEKIHEQKT